MTHELHDVLNELLVDIFNHILVIEERYHKAKGIKLSMNEIHTLEAVDKSESKTMGDVAKRLHITQGTLTVNINRLTNKGYVYRVQDQNDRRIYRLKLTDKAKDVMMVHDAFHEAMTQQLMEQVSSTDQQALAYALQRINNFFKQNYE